MIDLEYKCPFCNGVNRLPRRAVTRPLTCRSCGQPAEPEFPFGRGVGRAEVQEDNHSRIARLNDRVSFPVAGWLLFAVGIATLVAGWFLFAAANPIVAPELDRTMRSRWGVICALVFVYIVIVTAGAAALDVKRLGLGRERKKSNASLMWVLGTFVVCTVMWLPMFPLYLLLRNRLARSVASGSSAAAMEQLGVSLAPKVSVGRLALLFTRLLAGLVAVCWAGPPLVGFLGGCVMALGEQCDFQEFFGLILARVGDWLVLGLPAIMVYAVSSYALSVSRKP